MGMTGSAIIRDMVHSTLIHSRLDLQLVSRRGSEHIIATTKEHDSKLYEIADSGCIRNDAKLHARRAGDDDRHSGSQSEATVRAIVLGSLPAQAASAARGGAFA
jgi:hypothetical protein